jgi:hypothetical protein
MQNTQKIITVTHIAKPIDKRCQWWQGELPKDLDIRHLIEKAPIKIFKRNADLELTPGTLLIDSEQVHHRKLRGYNVCLGFVNHNEIIWIAPTMARKQFIKNLGNSDLMKGSGDVVGAIRMALWLYRQPDIFEAFEELKNVK